MHTKKIFVIRNQFDQYLDKHSGWQSGKDAQALYRADHHDQALNTLIEINAKDISLRGIILEVDQDDKKRPIVEVSEAAMELDKDLAIMETENPSDMEMAGINQESQQKTNNEDITEEE